MIKKMIFLGAILCSILIMPIANAQQFEKMSFQESVTIIYDQKLSNSIIVSIGLETTDNKEIRFFVIIAEMKEENMATNKNSSNNEEENPETFQALGLSISNLTNDLKNQQNIPEKLKGLFVLDVEQNSDSERKGIRPGDIIVEAEQQVLNSLLDFKNILKKLRDLHRKSVLLLFNRGGNLTFIAVKLD